ncbi:hypothetical protein AnigIFM49718_000529 [Aspergillus niger]|nr:hypothetical protein AnigIFM49718_000529 [Aspergillus niger]
MELNIHALLHYLDGISGNALLAAVVRERAAYISASFLVHKNLARLMAHVTALANGEELIFHFHQIYGPNKLADVPVRRHWKHLKAVMADYRVNASVADIEGHPIQLISILDPTIEKLLQGEDLFQFHYALLRAEQMANEDLARLAKDYGYHYIFRIGLMEYYMTKTVAEKINFLKPDCRGYAYQTGVQACLYDAMEKRVRLNAAEKELILRAVDCQPDDAHRFWAWLECNRVAYNSMNACIFLLNKLEGSKYPTFCPE